MKKILVVFLIVIFALGLLNGCGGQQEGTDSSNSNDSAANTDKEYTIKAAHGASEETALHKGWLKFKEIVEQKSNGKIKVEIYPNQQLGGDREFTEAAQMGNVQMGSPSSAPLASFCKEFFVLDIPFLFKDRATVYKALDGEAGQALLDSLSQINLKGLGFWENGFRNLTNSKLPIKKPEDLKGLKIRTMENELHIAAWKMLGANPTPLAFGELFTALQQKTVDGEENPFELIYTNKLYEVQKYATLTQHIYSPYVVYINKNFYDSLPKEYQQIINDAVKEATDYQRKEAQAMDEKSQEAIKDKTQIIQLTDEERAAFVNKLTPMIDQAKAKAGEEIVNKFLEAVK